MKTIDVADATDTLPDYAKKGLKEEFKGEVGEK